MLSEPLLVVARLARAFDDLGIRYLVGGSLASAIYGKPRATRDVDLVAEIAPPEVEPLARDLAAEFYVDPDMIRDAIRRRASFNVVHLGTMFKADVFIGRDDAWSRVTVRRYSATAMTVPTSSSGETTPGRGRRCRGPGRRRSIRPRAGWRSASRAPKTSCCTSSSGIRSAIRSRTGNGAISSG
jgi:hypothetical protein